MWWNCTALCRVQQAHHFILVICTEEHSPGSTVKLVVVEASPAHGGGVHNGGHGSKVVQQYPIEQGFIAILQET